VEWLLTIPWNGRSASVECATPVSATAPTAPRARAPCWKCVAATCRSSSRTGKPVGRLIFEQLAGATDELYGANATSNYQGQGLKLSKHFRDFGEG